MQTLIVIYYYICCNKFYNFVIKVKLILRNGEYGRQHSFTKKI